jgi:hypothetical protein
MPRAAKGSPWKGKTRQSFTAISINSPWNYLVFPFSVEFACSIMELAYSSNWRSSYRRASFSLNTLPIPRPDQPPDGFFFVPWLFAGSFLAEALGG